MREYINTDKRVAILGGARMAEAFGNSFLLVVLPLYITSDRVAGSTFGIPEAVLIGILLSLTGLLGSLGQPFFGYVSDKLQIRKIFIISGLLVIALTDLVYILAFTYFWMFMVRFVQGVGSMLTVPTTIALINDYTETDTRGENMGVYTAMRLIGTGIGPVVAGVIVERGPYPINAQWVREIYASLNGLVATGTSYSVTEPVILSGFDAAFIVAAGGALLSAVLVTLYVFEIDSGDIHIKKPKSRFRVPGTKLLFDPVYHVSLGAFVFGVNLALVVAIQPQVNEFIGQGPTWFGIQLVAFGLPLVLFGALFGWASDRWGRRPFLVTGVFLLIPTTLAQGIVVTPEGMLLARIGAGLAGALAFSPSIALIGDVSTLRDSGSKLSLFTMSLGVGAGVSPIIAGALIQYGYIVPFAFGTVMASLLFIGAVTVLPETLNGDFGEVIEEGIAE